jgi:hypothetical protein
MIAVSLTSFLAAPAYALRPNTYVASYGADSGACSYTAPCRNFSYALSQVQAGGVVMAIDSAGYSSFTIDKAVTIAAPAGVSPLIVAPSNGVSISIGAGPNDTIALRGLTLDGNGTGADGVVFHSGGSLTIEDCVVRNMLLYGLYFQSNVTTAQTLTVSNSYFNNSAVGIGITTINSGAITASVERTGFSGNGLGTGSVSGGSALLVDGSSGSGALTVAVTDSVAANNNVGFAARSSAGQSITNLALTNVQVTGNAYGIGAYSGATLWLAHSTLTGNASEFDINGGAINSYGDNYAAANPTANGSLGTATKQ